VAGYQRFMAVLTFETLISYYNTTRHHNLEDGNSMYLWNVGILPQHYIASKPWRWRQHGSPKRWHPITTLHGVTTLKRWHPITTIHGVKTLKMEAAWTSETLVSYNTEWLHNPEDLNLKPVHYQLLSISEISYGLTSMNFHDSVVELLL